MRVLIILGLLFATSLAQTAPSRRLLDDNAGHCVGTLHDPMHAAVSQIIANAANYPFAAPVNCIEFQWLEGCSTETGPTMTALPTAADVIKMMDNLSVLLGPPQQALPDCVWVSGWADSGPASDRFITIVTDTHVEDITVTWAKEDFGFWAWEGSNFHVAKVSTDSRTWSCQVSSGAVGTVSKTSPRIEISCAM